jgi:serine/threonine protein kinase
LCKKADKQGNFTAMLTDFGFAQPLETNDETLKLGTKKFMAPELYGS